MEKFLSVFKEKYYFYLVLILVVFIPIYPKLPLIGVGGTYVSIRAEDFFIFLTGLLWFVFYYKDLRKYLKQPIYQAFILFWSIGLLSLISAFTITYFIQPHLGILHWLRRIEYMSLFIIAATTIKSVDQIKLILKVFLAATVFIILYGFGQQWLNFPVISTTNREFAKGLILFLTPEARVNSTFAGHYDLAAYLTVVLVILSSLFFFYKSLRSKLIVGSIGLLSFVLLGMTAARASFAAVLAGIALSFWLNQKKMLIIVLFVLALSTVAVIPDLRHRLVATITVNLLGGGGPKYTLPEGVSVDPSKRLTEEERVKVLEQVVSTGGYSTENIATVASDIAPGEPINSTELGVYRSYGIRLDVEWPRALRAFYKNPFLGTGYSSLSIATDNDILRSLGEVGLLGTLALFLIFWILFKNFWKFLRKSQGFERFYIVGIICSVFGLLLTSLFIDLFEASKIATLMWFFLGVTWAMVRNYRDD